MAAELPYATAPTHTHKPASSSSSAAAATTTGRVSRANVGILFFLALNLALSVRRVWYDGAALACVVATYLNLEYTLRFEATPEGSPASGRARLAGWVLTATQTAAFAWKIGEVFPLGIAVAAWVLAAATVGGGYYFMFLHDDDEKPI